MAEETVDQGPGQEELLQDLRHLLRSPGWGRLVKIAETQCHSREREVLAPLGGKNPYEMEFQKGEIAGIRLFMQLPEIAVENLKDLNVEDDNESA